MDKIQQALKVPKAQQNEFGHYSYRSCEDIVEMVKPILHDRGYYLNITDELVLIGDRYYIKARAAVMVVMDEGVDRVIANSTGYAREALNKKGMDESQITGAASSYARKYALNGLFSIDDTRDADTHEAAHEPADPDYSKKYEQSVIEIKAGIMSGDLSAAAEEWFTLPREVIEALWVAPRYGGLFTTQQREVISSTEFREAHYGEGKTT